MALVEIYRVQVFFSDLRFISDKCTFYGHERRGAHFLWHKSYGEESIVSAASKFIPIEKILEESILSGPYDGGIGKGRGERVSRGGQYITF